MPRILIVDDNPADVLLLRYALEAVGAAAQLSSAADGEAALRHLRSHPLPDLIVLDLFLGGEPSLDFLQHLRSELGRQTPVLLLSGLIPLHFEEIARMQGIAYFEKPPLFEGWCELAKHLMHPDACFRTVTCAA